MSASVRSVIDVVIAVLLGLVSVTTALGAYQASVWATESSDLRLVASDMRDRNLTGLLTAQLIAKEDGAKLYDAFALESQITLYPERTDELRHEQQSLLGSSSPEFAASWEAWRASGFADELAPITQPGYEAGLFAEPHSLQYTSFVANTLADAAELRSQQATVASVIFAVALLLLGIAGVNASWRLAAWLVGGATLVYLGGLVFTIIAVL